MLSTAPAGPTVIGERLIGPSDACTAIQLQFSESLDPTTATNPKAYNFGILSTSSSNDNGLGSIFGNPFFPFLARPGAASGSGPAASGRVLHPNASLGSVTYDDSTHTVTLLAARPFLATTFLRFIRIKGTGENAIRDSQGVALAGNGHTASDESIHLRVFRGKSFGYTDSQGSRVALRIKGPGAIVGFLPNRGNRNAIVFLLRTTADSTTLTGTIKPAKGQIAVTTVQELSGVSSVKNQLGTGFQFGLIQP